MNTKIETPHIPVLATEIIDNLAIRPGGTYLDATVGLGGHSSLILEAAPDVRVVAIDRDTEALDIARQTLDPWRDRVQFWHGNFAEFPTPEIPFDGIIADLGVSSPQLDRDDRGFSFRHEGPLDMRMDRQQTLTAAEIVNTWEETKLANIIYNYGEERLSRRIARAIASQRPFRTTTELAEAIAACVPRRYRYGRIHPATRTFQALRVELNQELTSLSAFLDRLPVLLAPEGRIAIVSFHSLEDRAVKHQFRAAPQLRVLTKKPVVASDSERQTNPRSRSAKLRVAQRLAESGANAVK